MERIDLAAAVREPIQGHTSKGDQPKWRRGSLWYKADHMGYEALAEVVVSLSLIHIWDKLLKAANPSSVALKYKSIVGMKRQERQELVKGMSVVYIYHDVIDKAGHTSDNAV